MDRRVKRALLKPLARRRQQVTDRKTLLAALDRLNNRALGEELLSEIVGMVSASHGDRDSWSWKNPDAVRESVVLGQALYASRRISRQEYIFFAASPVEGIHESRWIDGEYEELQPIQQAIDAVLKESGLGPDEYWAIGEGPEKYTSLNDQYSAILEKNLLRTLREFGLNDLADLREQNPDGFEKLRERGRRSVFHKEEIVFAIKDIVVRYEEDARRAASAKAYSAAVTLLGAGVEGLLLLRCLRSKQKSLRVASTLPKRQRPRFPDDPTKWNFETLIDTCLAAGWLPPVSTPVAQYDPAGLAHTLRLMRNYVHPGRHARDRPWLETDEEDYKDAEAIYVTLLAAVLASRGRVKAGSKAQHGAPADRPKAGGG